MCAGEAVGNTQCQVWDEAKWPQHRPLLFMRKGRRWRGGPGRRECVQVIQGDDDDEITKQNLTPLCFSFWSFGLWITLRCQRMPSAPSPAQLYAVFYFILFFLHERFEFGACVNVLVASGYCGARARPKILVVTCRVLGGGERQKKKKKNPNTAVHCSTVTSFLTLASPHSEMLRLPDSSRLCSGSTVIKWNLQPCALKFNFPHLHLAAARLWRRLYFKCWIFRHSVNKVCWKWFSASVPIFSYIF